MASPALAPYAAAGNPAESGSSAAMAPVAPTDHQVVVGTIVGRVTDRRSGVGLAETVIQVVGFRLGATTDGDGRYRIANFPAGSHVVIARRIGYESDRQTVTVVDGQETTADFTLEAAVVALDEVVVTGAAGGEQRRSIGNAVSTIDADLELQRSAAPNLTSLIQSRAPGVIITPSTGRIGAGPTIQIRGRSSLSLGAEPIINVDGVRVNNATDQGPTGAGGFSAQNSEVASRLNDINPEDIESIEIIKGPAAATIYGTEASNGVIQIITKRGAGRPRWTAKPRTSLAARRARCPSRWRRSGAIT